MVGLILAFWIRAGFFLWTLCGCYFEVFVFVGFVFGTVKIDVRLYFACLL